MSHDRKCMCGCGASLEEKRKGAKYVNNDHKFSHSPSGIVGWGKHVIDDDFEDFSESEVIENLGLSVDVYFD